MVAQELTQEEIIAAKKAGINLQQFFAVENYYTEKINILNWVLTNNE